MTNTPDDLIMQNIDIKFPPDARSPEVQFWSSLHERWDRGFLQYILHLDGFGLRGVTSERWQGKLFMTPDADENYGFTPTYFAKADRAEDWIRGTLWFWVPAFRVVDDSVASFINYAPSPDLYRSPDGGTMRFGYAPLYPRSWLSIKPDRVAVFIGFRGALNEERDSDSEATRYVLQDAQFRTVTEGEGGRFESGVEPGIHQALFTNPNYDVAGIPGKGRLTLRFDTRRTDPLPPTLTSMKLLDADGVPTDHLANGEAATLLFSAIDQGQIDDSLLFLPLASEGRHGIWISSLPRLDHDGEMVRLDAGGQTLIIQLRDGALEGAPAAAGTTR